MSYLPALLGTIAVYGLLAVLLLSLNIFSLWRWWVKLGMIVVTCIVILASYFAISGLIGWPSPQGIPGRFSLVATRVVEPDKASGAAGHLYMWVEEVDEKNIPVSQPRAHEVAYTDAFADALRAAQTKLNNGQEVLGEMLEQKNEEAQPRKDQQPGGDPGQPDQPNDDTQAQVAGGQQSPGMAGDGYLLDVTDSLKLSDMPPPELPSKQPLN